METSLKEYLTSVTDAFLRLYNKDGHIQFVQDFEDIPVPARLAIPIGIIANELLTNAVKYAFGNRTETAKILILLRREGEIADFQVFDNGKGFDGTNSNPRKGFGISMVGMLAETIRGSFEMVSEGGTRCILRFPLA